MEIDSDMERYLLVKEGKVNWSIQSSTNATEAYITSGRATNSPTAPEAGSSLRFGRTRWRWAYSDPEWKEGDITVECIDDQ